MNRLVLAAALFASAAHVWAAESGPARYLKDPKLLAGAWLPPKASPYAPYVKLQTLLGAGQVQEALLLSCPGTQPPEAMDLALPDSRPAVILDLPAALSVETAARLSLSRSYQAVPLLAAEPEGGEPGPLGPAYCALAGRAKEMEAHRKKLGKGSKAPPVFILDRGRDSRRKGSMELPKADDFVKWGVTKVLYVGAPDLAGVSPDLKGRLWAYSKTPGFTVAYLAAP